MFSGTEQRSSGLVFLNPREFDIAQIGRLASDTLEASGQRVESLRVTTPQSAEFSTAIYNARVNVIRRTGLGRRDAGTADTPLAGARRTRATTRPQNPLSQAHSSLQIDLAPRESGQNCDWDLLQSLLANTTYQMALLEDADYLQWLTPECVVPTCDFSAMIAPVAPRRVRRQTTRILRDTMLMGPTALREAGLSDNAVIDECFRTLDRALDLRRAQPAGATGPAGSQVQSGDETVEGTLKSLFASPAKRARAPHPNPEEDATPQVTAKVRLAAWMLCIAVGLFMLPIAVFLVICNLTRGEDFRLAAHAMSLSGLMMALQSNGAFAQVATAVGL